MAALKLGPVDPDAVLGDFTWDACADIFEAALVPCTPAHATAFAARDIPHHAMASAP